MKKTLLLFTLIFHCIILTAQLHLNVGANTGKYKTTINFQDKVLPLTNFESQYGFYAGLSYDKKIKRIIVNPELNYINFRCKFPEATYGTLIKNTFAYNYIQVPVFLKYSLMDSDSNQTSFIKAGPYIGYGIGKLSNRVCNPTECVTAEFAYNDGDQSFKNIDYGFQFGIGINITNALAIELRYMLGLANINKANIEAIKTKNSAFNFGISYRIFDFKSKTIVDKSI